MKNWLARIMRFFRSIPDPQDELVGVICTCIYNDYASWKSDGYRFIHPALQFSIWIANSENSVGLEVNGRPAWPQYHENKNSIVLTKKQKRMLWGAIHNPNSSDKKKREVAEEIISRVMAHYSKDAPSGYFVTTATTKSRWTFNQVQP